MRYGVVRGWVPRTLKVLGLQIAKANELYVQVYVWPICYKMVYFIVSSVCFACVRVGHAVCLLFLRILITSTSHICDLGESGRAPRTL